MDEGEKIVEIRPKDIAAAKQAAINAMGLGLETVAIDPLMLFAMAHTIYTKTTFDGSFLTMESAVRQGAEPVVTVRVLWAKA